MDGKTLKPENFYLLWAIYGLPGDAFPMVGWEGSLQKVANARNDIAHGNMPFEDIFKYAGRGPVDVEGYLNDLCLFAIHLVSQWEDYLVGRMYLAIP